MDIFGFLVTPAICGIVGYFTNWIAIKMLFVPREEKRIFNFRLPFTPGVIPKSKDRMAATVGETIGTYLLTQDAIKEVIQNARIGDYINNLIDMGVENLKQSEDTFHTLLDKALDGNKDAIADKILYELSQAVFSYIEEEKNQLYIEQFLTDKLKIIAEAIYPYMYAEIFLIKTENFMNNQLNRYLKSDEFRIFISENADQVMDKLITGQKSIKDTVPEEIIDEIKRFAGQKAPDAVIFLKRIINEHQAIDDKLMELTKKLLERNVGNLIGGLVYKKMYESIKSGINSYLDEEETVTSLINLLNNLIDQICENNLGYYLEKLKNNDGLEETLTSVIYNGLSHDRFLCFKEELLSNITTFAMEKLEGKNFYKIICFYNPNGFDAVVDKIKTETLRYYYTSGKALIDQQINKGYQKLFSYKVSTFMDKLGSKPSEELKNFVLSKQQFILDRAAVLIANKLQVTEIVEKKIIDYDVFELEKMILSIVEKELRYVTLMGGVLGAILGFIPGLIQMLIS